MSDPPKPKDRNPVAERENALCRPHGDPGPPVKSTIEPVAIGRVNGVDRKILAQGRYPAGVGDECDLCNDDTDVAIMAGFTDVWVGEEVRLAGDRHQTSHSATVKILEPSAFVEAKHCTKIFVNGGTTVGNVAAALAACREAQATRRGLYGAGRDKQSYANNCGVESSRQIINRQRTRIGGPPLTEDELLRESARAGRTNVAMSRRQWLACEDDPNASAAEKKRRKALHDKWAKAHAKTEAAQREADRAMKNALDGYAKHPADEALNEKNDAADKAAQDKLKAAKAAEAEAEGDLNRDVDVKSQAFRGSEEAREKQANRSMNTGGDDDTGLTDIGQRKEILKAHGIESHDVPVYDNITQKTDTNQVLMDVGQGKGVMTHHDAGALWDDNSTSKHVVLLVGAEYDAQGNLKQYIINDTGAGTCAQRVDKDRYESSLTKAPANVTDKPVWA